MSCTNCLQVQDQLLQLRRRLWLQAAALATTVLALFVGGFVHSKHNDETSTPPVLRVRGLIVEDAEGRERILIGAPVPKVDHRIRTDFAKAKKAWGDRYPNMDWYKRLEHNPTGMVILDEKGHDRISFGVPQPDPNVGRRVAPSIGFAINDEQGFERSGWSHFPGRAVGFGLDHPNREGLNLFLFDDGSVGMLVRDDKGTRQTFVGHANKGTPWSGIEGSLQGLAIRDEHGPSVVVNAASPAPSIEIREAGGKTMRKLTEDAP